MRSEIAHLEEGIKTVGSDLVDFLKKSCLVTCFLTKGVQIFSNLWGYYDKCFFFPLDTFWHTVRNIWATFYSNIWSHLIKLLVLCHATALKMCGIEIVLR